MELIKRICIFFYLTIGFLTLLNGEIQITESVNQFRYPKFSDNGFIEWVLEGKSGTYDQSNISIENLKLRIYSGDQSARSLSNITGENCIFDSDAQIAKSNDSILIKGSGFDLSGNQWAYDLSNEIISVNSDATVRFSQNIDSIFSGVEQEGETTIKSDQMRLIIEPTRYLFTFEGNCTLSSDSITLNSELLELELLNNSNRINFTVPTGELSGMKSIYGKGDVQFTGMEQLIQSEEFSIEPKENKAIFSGNALIQYNQIILKGDLIDLKQYEVEVLSLDNNLSSFSNSKLDDQVSNYDQSSIFIQSKNIALLKQTDTYEYYFEKDVFFISELYKINSEWLYLKTEEILDINSDEMFQNITITEAKDNVIVKHADYQISGGNLKYLPIDNQLEISNEVAYMSDFAKLKSDHLIIENNTLFAHSDHELIEVILPNTSDFNFEFNEDFDSSEESENSATVVYSNDLKINTDDTIYDCIFTGAVSLINGNFTLNSDQLTMKWEPMQTDTINTAEYTIDKMIADGSVTMEQLNYFASANTVEILPDRKMFHLLGDAHFKDSNGSIWGEQIEFDRKLKQTKVTGSQAGERARIQFDIFGTGEENLEESSKE